jgi:rhamnogalacturonan endolyase
VQRAWFLRDGENGLHSFVRMHYYNSTYSPGALGESRTMFRPNNALGASPWTHIVTDDEQWVRARAGPCGGCVAAG